MKLFLIRHGETVDNIAGNLAGVTDSQLTNYGVDQTKQLGKYFATTNVIFTHIFASPLSRAARTAQAIVDAQPRDALLPQQGPTFTLVPDLIEQDFGSNEGKPFGSRSSPSRDKRQLGPGDIGFVEVETKEAMGRRSDRFIMEHLLPAVGSSVANANIAIVAHGMLLSTLWRRILLRIPRKSLSIAPEVTAARGSLILEHLGGWSNTGYLELHLDKNVEPLADAVSSDDTGGSTILSERCCELSDVPAAAVPDIVSTTVTVSPTVHTEDDKIETTQSPAASPESTTAAELITGPAKQSRKDFTGLLVTIAAIDSRTHLVGLKRQRGGIGRLAHDESQKKLTSFFKKPRTS